MEVELRRLEDLSDAIVESFNHMRKREDEMRGTNGIISTIKTFIHMNSQKKLKFWFLFRRTNEQSSFILQRLFHALFAGFDHMASVISSSIFQSQKAH